MTIIPLVWVLLMTAIRVKSQFDQQYSKDDIEQITHDPHGMGAVHFSDVDINTASIDIFLIVTKPGKYAYYELNSNNNMFQLMTDEFEINQNQTEQDAYISIKNRPLNTISVFIAKMDGNAQLVSSPVYGAGDHMFFDADTVMNEMTQGMHAVKVSCLFNGMTFKISLVVKSSKKGSYLLLKQIQNGDIIKYKRISNWLDIDDNDVAAGINELTFSNLKLLSKLVVVGVSSSVDGSGQRTFHWVRTNVIDIKFYAAILFLFVGIVIGIIICVGCYCGCFDWIKKIVDCFKKEEIKDHQTKTMWQSTV